MDRTSSSHAKVAGCHSLKQISEAVGLPASTTHRLVNSLVAIGYLSGNDPDKTYYIGRRLLLILHTAFRSRKVQARAEPALKRLMQSFGLVLYVDQLIAEKARMVAFVLPECVERALVIFGEHTPINATAAGKAIFAFQEARIIDRQFAGDLPKFQPKSRRRSERNSSWCASAATRSPAMNILEGTVVDSTGTTAHCRLNCGITLALAAEPGRLSKGEAVSIGMRPENLRIAVGKGTAPAFAGSCRASRRGADPLCGPPRSQRKFLVKVDGESSDVRSQSVELTARRRDIHILDAGGNVIPIVSWRDSLTEHQI
ncbi:helix-turn-helix domain-containing protein [Mesorhizobium sp.]|uniref:helix-turn-helix domain-containing protein n=1 Tax=Mesorhizobium sp. TaxID=1871066 RepID=UPI000FEA1223|nr:helix-turn-helix domain-containing protein [Mesorhizobium sp.]RWI88898.1 MAG: hypothetical protein EOR21_26275 [Mesorhizobium sp.]